MRKKKVIDYQKLKAEANKDSISLVHQKTALADGFNVTVVGKPTIVPYTELMIIYHKRPKLSSNNKYLRGADGIRTRSFCVGDSRSTISLPPHKHGGSNIISNAILKINCQKE